MKYAKEIFDLIAHNALKGVLNASDIPNRIEYDTRRIIKASNTLFVAINSSNRNGHEYIPQAYDKGVRNFIVHHSVKLSDEIKDHSNIYYVNDSLSFLYNIASIWRNSFSGKVIGVTGSKGKTTVKEWLSIALRSLNHKVDRSPRSYNSALGVPLSILSLNQNMDYWIIEAGISMMNEMELISKLINPDYGLLAKMGKEHEEGFENDTIKLKEKIKLFNNCEWWIGEDNDLIDIEPSLLSKNWNYEGGDYNSVLVKEFITHLGYDFQESQDYPKISTKWSIRKGLRYGELIVDSFGNDTKSLDVALGYLMARSERKKVVIIGEIRDDENESENDLLIDWSNIPNIQFYCLGWKDRSVKAEHIAYFDSEGQLLDCLSNIEHSDILIKGEEGSFKNIARYLDSNIHQAYVSIDFDAVRHNIKYLRKHLPESAKLMAMVKAESYGAGSEEVGIFLQEEGIEAFGVAYLSEAISLRKRGITNPILVMNVDSDFDLVEKYNLSIALYSFYQLDQIKNYPEINRLKVHIKVDTGMHRLGFDIDELTELRLRLKSSPCDVFGLMSHFHASDEEDEIYMNNQIKKFDKASEIFPNTVEHLFNTSAILNHPNLAKGDLYRAGIGLFGIDPMFNKHQLKIAMNVYAKVIQIKSVKKGDVVGYGIKGINEDTKIAILNMGYADGISRKLGYGNWEIAGCNTIGSICMDFMFIDIKDNDIHEGQILPFFDSHFDLYKMSSILETIPYEVMTSFTGRLNKKYIQE